MRSNLYLICFTSSFNHRSTPQFFLDTLNALNEISVYVSASAAAAAVMSSYGRVVAFDGRAATTTRGHKRTRAKPNRYSFKFIS